MSSGAEAHGHSAKHVHHLKHHKSKKHHPTAHKKVQHHKKHHVHAKGTHAHHAKARGYALESWLLPVCSFEALAMSLRLAGQFVDDDEVAWLWSLAGALPAGAPIEAALDAASLHGLAARRPRRKRVEWLGPVRVTDDLRLPGRDSESAAPGPFEDFLAGDGHALILGVDRPGPHAVLATADGWWSWGKRYDPWDCRIEEAWAVSWDGR